MRIALIAAMAKNRIIGRNNQLPWRIPADLKHFKVLTMGKPIIMGRKTYESIGRPLPGRDNIVLTGDVTYRAEGCEVVHSIAQALQVAGAVEEAMIVGGSDLYRQTIGDADRLYLTLVKAEVEGDAWFPKIDSRQWREIKREAHRADDSNQYDYAFVVLERAR